MLGTTLIADVCLLLAARPFEPFFIMTTGGIRYRILSPDHAAANPQRTRLVIWFDDGSSVTVSGTHISAIEKEARKGM